jgi:hypothetical protein
VAASSVQRIHLLSSIDPIGTAMTLKFIMLVGILSCCASFNVPGGTKWTTTKLQAATAFPVDTPFVGTPSLDVEDEPRLGVLLLNLGGPETGDDVEGM